MNLIRRSLNFAVAAGVILALSLSVATPIPALGASFAVDSAADSVDANPGDGVCADATGECTLRASVMETNALPGADQIAVPSGTYSLAIPGGGEDGGTTGDIDIADELTLMGAGTTGATIDAGALDRVFHIRNSAAVHIEGVTIRNGNQPLALDGGGGVKIDLGTKLQLVASTVTENVSTGWAGGIDNIGILEVNETTIERNTAPSGGGIYNHLAATIDASVVRDNQATGGDGGGITNSVSATLAITGSTVEGNSASFSGGGIFNTAGTMTVSDSRIRDNIAKFVGGGVFNVQGTFSLDHVNVEDNSTTLADGGGIYNSAFSQASLSNSAVRGNVSPLGAGIANHGPLAIAGSSIVQNESTSGDGGGVLNGGAGSTDYLASLEVRDSMVSGNRSAGAGGGITTESGIVTLTGTRVKDNVAAARGGGINIEDVDNISGPDDVPVVNIFQSEVSANKAPDGGGISNDGRIDVQQSTVSGNQGRGIATTGSGFQSGGHFSTASLSNSTVSGNNGDGIANHGVLGLMYVTITANTGYGLTQELGLGGTSIANSINAGNGLPSCSTFITVSGPNNLFSDSSCLNPGQEAIVTPDPRLGPLSANGGATMTHPLLTGSEAIDASLLLCGTDGGFVTDQRGVMRPLDGDGDGVASCDIGSYEAAPPETALAPTPSALPDTGGAPLRPVDSHALPVYQQVLATLVVAIVYTSPRLVRAATLRRH